MDIGIRAVLSNDVALPEHNLDTLADNKDAHDAVHGAGGGRVQVYVGIEWLPLASPELLRDARALADELGTGIHVHLNESLTEVEDSKSRFGRRPTEVAYDAGLLGPDCVAAHCVWLSDTEIALMRETGTHISPQPLLQRQARQRHRPPPGNARRRPQRRPRPRRGGVQQQRRPVRGHEVRLADAPRRAGRRQPAAGTGRAGDGDPQRRRRARARDRVPRAGAEGRRDPCRHPQRHVHAARRRQRRPALLPPGVRRQRLRRRHHHHRRQGRHARAASSPRSTRPRSCARPTPGSGACSHGSPEPTGTSPWHRSRQSSSTGS